MAAKKESKRTTTKKVQGSEKLPPKIKVPDVVLKPDADEDAWGDDGLTLRQRLFVKAYMGEAAGNATKAARIAGYRDDNYNALKADASRLLTFANVQRALERERGRRFGSEEDVRVGIAAIANSSAADYLKRGEDGKLHLDLEAMAEAGTLGLLAQVHEERIEIPGSPISTVKLKLKTYDRLKALELLAKMNGQLVDRVKHEGAVAVRTEAETVARALNDPTSRKLASELAERLACLPGNSGEPTNQGEVQPAAAPSDAGA